MRDEHVVPLFTDADILPLHFFYYQFVWPPVVQQLDSAIHWINRYPEDTFYENQLHYPLDSNLSSG